MNQKVVSFPKINPKSKRNNSSDLTRSSHPPPIKLNNQMQKMKWSLAPKCLHQGHDGKDIMYVCIHPNCMQPSRLVCQTCFFKSHQEHNQQFLAIDQIKRGEITKLRYWPFQQKFRKIYEFINEHDNYVSKMIQDVNATFQGMALRILSSIDKIRLQLLKKIDSFYIREGKKKQFVEKTKIQLQKSFQLHKIRDLVKKLFNKEMRHQAWSTQMTKLLKDPQMNRTRDLLMEYFQHTQKGKDMVFDKVFFLQKQNWIIDQIQQQKKSLRTADVHVQQTQLGIERVLPQALAYLSKYAQGRYPLTFQKTQLEDGSQYLGFYEKGVRTMFGMRKYKSGFTYYGQWRINAKNGWGIFENKAKGYKYSGAWKQDKRNGFGRQETLTSVYQGNYVGDKKEGFGIMTQDGVRYQVTWKNDKKHGNGKKVQKNGQQSDVYYLNGIQSTSKGNKVNTGFNLNALTKRFASKSTAQLSQAPSKS